MARRVALCVLSLAVLAGCGSGRSILYSGVSSGLGGKKLVITDSAAVRDGRSDRTDWLAMIRRVGQQGVDAGFSSLSPQGFRRRLAAAAVRDRFTVKRVVFLHHGKVTPLVVVETSRYLAFARAVPAIERSLDPHTGRSDLKGWRYQAFSLEALDERGVPFLIVSNVVGGGTVAGGQWARSDALFPFAHG